jgi:hypothetical protein
MAPMSWKNTSPLPSLDTNFSHGFPGMVEIFEICLSHIISLYSIIITKAIMKDILDLQVLGAFSGPCRGSKKTLDVSRSPRQLLRRKARPEKSSCAQNHQRVIALVSQLPKQPFFNCQSVEIMLNMFSFVKQMG